MAVINSTLGSSLPSNAINYIAPYFHVTNEQQLVLPISLFLVGYVLGPLIFGPLSETYGRKLIMLSSFVAFTLFTMAWYVHFGANLEPFPLLKAMLIAKSAQCPGTKLAGVPGIPSHLWYQCFECYSCGRRFIRRCLWQPSH